MKVIFLDVDGVLNNSQIIQDDYKGIGVEQLKLLKKIVEETNSKIVVSSTWRLYPEILKELTSKLMKFGIFPIDKTKDLKIVERKEEIEEWLSRNEVENFAILDDDIDAEIEGHFFLTDFQFGLTEEISNKVIDFLK
jgi:hypothetical protein